MAEFLPNKPVEVDAATKGVVDVTFGNAASALPPGVHTIQLEVIDDLGVKSDPVTRQITVQAKPVAVLGAPERVALGQGFKLDGSKSSVQGGKIVKWIFTRLAKPPEQ